jgi:hypothetical protein
MARGLPPLFDPTLSNEYRQQTPGYPEYASQALHELFPTPAHLLEALGIPLVSDAASLAIGAKEGSKLGMGLGLLGALPFVPGSIKSAAKIPKRESWSKNMRFIPSYGEGGYVWCMHGLI